MLQLTIILKGSFIVLIDRTYRISVFGDFMDISPTSDNMMFLIEAFKEYNLVPSLFQEVKSEDAAMPPVLLQRIALVPNQENNISEESITILSNRINYNCNIIVDIQLTDQYKKIINEKAYKAFNIIFKKFNKKATRLALNTESLIVGLSDAEAVDFMSLYTNPISLYNSQAMTEWGIHLTAQKRDYINNQEEVFNIITNIGKADLFKQEKENVKQDKGFIVNIDINTIAENTSQRFMSEDIPGFIDVTKTWWNTIIEDK